VTRRKVFWSLACVAVGVAIGVAMRPPGGAARTQGNDPISAFIGAVPRASSGQFPTPQAAVRFLVQQVKTQNYVEAMRVLPIVERDRRATFSLYVKYLQTVDLNSFFPKQPLSKFDYAAMRPLFDSYTKFTLLLLYPQLVSGGAVAVPNDARLKELEQKLDPIRLSGLRITSLSAPIIGPKPGRGDGSGVTAQGAEDAVLVGVGPARKFDFLVQKIGSNWFVAGVDTA
jgi:hypothetical protein